MFRYDRNMDANEKDWGNRDEQEKALLEILDIIYKYQISLANARMLLHDVLIYIEEKKIIRRD